MLAIDAHDPVLTRAHPAVRVARTRHRAPGRGKRAARRAPERPGTGRNPCCLGRRAELACAHHGQDLGQGRQGGRAPEERLPRRSQGGADREERQDVPVGHLPGQDRRARGARVRARGGALGGRSRRRTTSRSRVPSARSRASPSSRSRRPARSRTPPRSTPPSSSGAPPPEPKKPEKPAAAGVEDTLWNELLGLVEAIADPHVKSAREGVRRGRRRREPAAPRARREDHPPRLRGRPARAHRLVASSSPTGSPTTTRRSIATCSSPAPSSTTSARSASSRASGTSSTPTRAAWSATSS